MKLSPREREVLILFVEKEKLTLVAKTLGSSISTVRTQKYNIMRKLGEKTSVGLVRTAIQKGLVKG